MIRERKRNRQRSTVVRQQLQRMNPTAQRWVMGQPNVLPMSVPWHPSTDML